MHIFDGHKTIKVYKPCAHLKYSAHFKKMKRILKHIKFEAIQFRICLTSFAAYIYSLIVPVTTTCTYIILL